MSCAAWIGREGALPGRPMDRTGVLRMIKRRPRTAGPDPLSYGEDLA